MGVALFKAFPFIDAVCLGEGEEVFAALAAAVLNKPSPGEIPGILHRGTADPAAVTAAMVADLDGLPYPDGDDFFAQREQYPNPEIGKLHLVIETSRGCWWGQKSQCAFCGLNVNALAYRQKSAPRALEEFSSMLDRYGSRTRSLRAADTILPKSFPETFFPLLERSGLKPEIFYYIRSDLTKDQVRAARRAGLREIQPGIESLSRAALKRMRKGVTPLQNVRLLKWCKQFGVFPIWYYLYGMPGERPEEYQEGLRILKAISHLTPPARVSRVRIDRYSPFQMRPTDFGLRNLRPSPLYRFIYSGLDESAIRDLAYYFDADSDSDSSIAPLTASLLAAIEQWTQAAAGSALISLDEPERLVICDFRPGAATAVHVLTGLPRRAYEACEEIRTRSDLRKLLGEETGSEMTEEDLQAVLQPLLDADLLIEEKDQILSLAVPLGFEYFPPEALWPRFSEIPEA
jgi:ribosomal peptide maturation radical SAM protein 1